MKISWYKKSSLTKACHIKNNLVSRGNTDLESFELSLMDISSKTNFQLSMKIFLEICYKYQ